ncbi:unnamed protein product [Camellia sinensis]
MVTCRLLGVVLEETSPEELQKQATVRSSVLEVLLEITKFCDLYLMERVMDVETEIKVSRLENGSWLKDWSASEEDTHAARNRLASCYSFRITHCSVSCSTRPIKCGTISSCH